LSLLNTLKAFKYKYSWLSENLTGKIEFGGDILRNRLKAILEMGKVALGAWMTTGSVKVAWTLANSGIDWILFDLEHGPCSIETVDKVIHYLRGCPAVPLIRVVWNDVNAIKRALDTGAWGVVIPWVSTKEEAERAVKFCKYPPEGIRGAAPARPAEVWGITPNEYLLTANKEIMVIIQIEREEAVENIEEILSVKGIDATFIGPTDLSNSMGYVGNPFHPKVVEAMDRILKVSKEKGVTPGIAYGLSDSHIKELIEKGFRFIGIGSELSLLKRGCENALQSIKGE